MLSKLHILKLPIVLESAKIFDLFSSINSFLLDKSVLYPWSFEQQSTVIFSEYLFWQVEFKAILYQFDFLRDWSWVVNDSYVDTLQVCD
jgi:hypothetical protein